MSFSASHNCFSYGSKPLPCSQNSILPTPQEQWIKQPQWNKKWMQASGRVWENDAHTCVLWWKITGWSEGREQRDKAAVQQPGLVCLGAVCPQGLAVSTAARVGTGGDQPTAGNTPHSARAWWCCCSTQLTDPRENFPVAVCILVFLNFCVFFLICL